MKTQLMNVLTEIDYTFQPSHEQITHEAQMIDTVTLASNQTITFAALVTTREYLTTIPTLSLQSVEFLNENVTIVLDEPYASCAFR